MVAKSQRALAGASAQTSSEVTLWATIKTQKMAAIVDGKLTVFANVLVEEELLLASLFEDVEVRSLIERRYRGKCREF